MHPDLAALPQKLRKVLSQQSEYVVTQPAELRVLREMSDAQISEFAKESRLARNTSAWGAADRILTMTPANVRCRRDR